ncbi:glutathione S-transferase family protein [Allonocardiopsis opalescens]|uniref:Putative glutathione S-transferase n=1 Tax=Allonocardiopsis opalescens TaxID=1144618 RepID=A0A2T0QDV1_9ACTN|nr:glutathione S-transferase family protein [Allonocardiopsis opalescens]PRY02072.1 putative glutathione S-transferase [Allonocardiopsis opalescens]
MSGTPQFSAENAQGRFHRQANRFTSVITADGSSGYPVEPGRYQLYVSLACPWAHRSLIVRRLLGLEAVVGVTVVDPIRDDRGWRFTLNPEGRDPVSGAQFLGELYRDSDPEYQGRYTVPMIWDRSSGRVVTNDFPAITIMFETEFRRYHRPGAPDLYPAELRGDIDAINALVYHTVNNGVYKAGFATSQAAYEDAFDALFTTFDALEDRLARRRFLIGDRLTEADVRLFTTLVRFDAVYYTHFKCNLRRLIDYPNLWAYARDLYQRPGFGDTTDFVHIKRHYFQTHDQINPNRLVPKGPYIDWTEPADRSHLPERA